MTTEKPRRRNIHCVMRAMTAMQVQQLISLGQGWK